MEFLEGTFRLIETVLASISAIAGFCFIVKFVGKTKGNDDIKLIKVFLYTAITIGTMYDFLWKPGSNTLLNLFIFLVSFFEIYSNADDIIFLLKAKKRIVTIGNREYKVRILQNMD